MGEVAAETVICAVLPCRVLGFPPVVLSGLDIGMTMVEISAAQDKDRSSSSLQATSGHCCVGEGSGPAMQPS
jgi:hypothetical protein